MSDIKKTVTFTEGVAVLDHNGAIAFEASAGETIDLPAPSANRWIRRGKAIEGNVKVVVSNEATGKTETDLPETFEKQPPITAETQAPAPKKKRAYTKKKAAPKKQAD